MKRTTPTLAGLFLAVCGSAAIADDLPCAENATCMLTSSNGEPSATGDHLAQCSGTFPDFITDLDNVPPDYDGPFFELSQDYPSGAVSTDLPWEAFDFTDPDQADDYLYALRDYSFEGMIEADFVPSANSVRDWYHVPMMNFDRGARDMVHGVTKERTLPPGEIGLVNYVSNYAVGFYNAIGAETFGRVFADPGAPDISDTTFANGAMVFKILFTTAVPDDFEDSSNYILEGAPAWEVAVGKNELTTIRLLQMDVAVRDDRAKPSGWVFGTFAFEASATDPVAWNRLRPVGLAWGDDPGYTPANQAAGDPLLEGIVSAQIPKYAAGHLGWAGRVNGPVDNPASSCISCHGTAQYPVEAIMLPTSACDTIEKKLYYFRNLELGEPFGGVNDACEPFDYEGKLTSLDFSLQMQVALQNMLDYGDVNPCTAAPKTAVAAAGSAAERRILPRIER